MHDVAKWGVVKIVKSYSNKGMAGSCRRMGLGRNMGYKRRAQILFLSGAHPALASLAAHYANQLGASWMAARAAVLPGVCGDVPELNAELLGWADLLVTLDAVALAARPSLRAGMQHRHYGFGPVPPGADKIAWREFNRCVRERVEGMIGGMRLLEKAARLEGDL